MAEPSVDLAQDKTPLEELEREITCAVCQGHYQRARLLPCNHYYCEACIEQLAKHSRGRPFDCPECRKEISLPAGGAAELQGAFFVERMKDVYGKMAKAEGKVDAVCEQCAGGKAVALCRQCAEFICGECVRSHQKMKAFSGHVVANLKDMTEAAIKNIPLKETSHSKCPLHDQLIKMYCFDCDQLICRDCTIIDHSGHSFNFLMKCAPEIRKALTQSLIPLQKVQDDFAVATDSLVNKENEIDAQEHEVCKSIEESIDQLKAVLNQRKAELVERAIKLAHEKKETLSVQKRAFKVAKTEIQLLVDAIERNMESTSDQDLMSIQTQLKAQMEEEKRDQELSLQPTATADMICLPPPLNTIPLELGLVCIQSTPRLLHVDEHISCEVGSPLDVRIFAPTTTPHDISAHLKCVANPALSLQGDVAQKGVGIYNISLTPQVKGQHALTVRVKDEEITGSPLRVFITIPPSQLSQNVRKIGGFKYPWGIAINDKQQLVVVESGLGGGRKVTVMERYGERVQTIVCTEFQNPHGVAMGADGAIYVSDIDAQCLFKFNAQGTLLKTVRNQLQMPLSVKIFQNRLYVADYGSSLVKVFDMQCNVVGTIQTKECPNPRDVAQGPDGLYVAGERKISIYTTNGVFTHHLNIHPPSLELSEFNGVCFHSNGDIIASDSDYGVYIFKPSGECVRLVASDVVSRPAGIAVDKHGFLCVCGFWSNNVVIFELE